MSFRAKVTMCFSDSFPPNNLVLSLLGLIKVQETTVETTKQAYLLNIEAAVCSLS